MKVAVYAIAKDEAAHVERWLAAVADADLVVVADTGSRDDTVARLRTGGASVHEVEVRPWRFDVARNRALALVPEDVDACFSLDLDDLPQPGWRAAVEAAWTPGVTRLHYRYVIGHGPDGEPEIEHARTKIHARRGYHWEHAVHEEVAPDDPAAEVVAPCAARVDHHPDPAKSRDAYLPLLELAVVEEPEQSQHAFWLGREYVYRGRWDQAVAELARYLALPEAVWPPERAAAMRFLAQASAALGRQGEAEAWLLRACAEAPDEREPWVDLAQNCHNAQDWAGGFAAARRALAITERPHHYLTTPIAWGERADDLAAVCAWWLGLSDTAREHVVAALRAAPNDLRIIANARFMGATGPATAGLHPSNESS